jgi:uncharacterized protein
MNKYHLLAILFFLAMALIGVISHFAFDAQAIKMLPTTPMTLGGQPFTLEIADTPQTRRQGLMHRKSMPADHGMIFVFPEPDRLEFYMKNTLIALDVVYLDAGGQVVSIHPLEPLDESTVASAGPAMYAIELNQGTAQRLGLKAGDKLTVPPGLRAR